MSQVNRLDSRESPQMCNLFTGCTDNITVCENTCKHKYWGSRGMCATIAPPPIQRTHRMALVQEDQETNMMDLSQETRKCKWFKCPCKCSFKKKPKVPCPKNSPLSHESEPMV